MAQPTRTERELNHSTAMRQAEGDLKPSCPTGSSPRQRVQEVPVMATPQDPKANDTQVQHCQPQPVLSVRATVPVAELTAAQGDALRALWNSLQHQGPPRPGWRELAGRCWHARPQPQALHEPGPAPEPATAGSSILSGRLRWLHRLPVVAFHRSPVPRAGQPGAVPFRRSGGRCGVEASQGRPSARPAQPR
jgi:hypothetical protein